MISKNMSNPTITIKKTDSKNGNKRSKIMKKIDISSSARVSKEDSTRNFVNWYKHKIDYERQDFCLYLCDSVVLEWFGRTVRTRKKVSAFLNYEMQHTQHEFKSIKKIEKLQSRDERDRSPDLSELATPFTSDLKKSLQSNKRKLTSGSNSPDWDTSNSVNIRFVSNNRKRFKTKFTETTVIEDKTSEISNNGDGSVDVCIKRKHTSVTPTNVEYGQGDCMPSTSGTDSDRSHENLNAQLAKLAVECNGFVQITRTRNVHCVDSMKWERKCKVQISYSEDPLNIGEYVIWALCYNDESKCRRNLLSAFEETEKEDND